MQTLYPVYTRFIAEGLFGPYLIILLAHSMGDFKAGIVAAFAFAIAALLQSKIGEMADLWGAPLVYASCAAAAVFSGLMQQLTQGNIFNLVFLILFIVAMRNSFFLSESIVAIDENYEKHRLLCTVIFGFFAFIGGLLLDNVRILQWIIITVMLLSSLISLRNNKKKPKPKVSNSSRTTDAKGNMWNFFPTMLAVFTVGLAVMGSEFYFSLIMQQTGYSGSDIGFFWVIEISAEALAFLLAKKFKQLLGAPNLIRIAIVLLIIRYALLIFSDSYYLIISSQIIAGFCFAWYLIGITSIAKKNSNETQIQQTLGLIVGSGLGSASVAAGLSGSLVIYFSSTEYLFHACIITVLFGAVINEMAAYNLNKLLKMERQGHAYSKPTE